MTIPDPNRVVALGSFGPASHIRDRHRKVVATAIGHGIAQLSANMTTGRGVIDSNVGHYAVLKNVSLALQRPWV